MNRKLIATATAALALLIAGCGSTTTPPANASGTAPKGAPLTIGVLAPMKGASAFPQTGYGAQGAEQYVNSVLGGINGRPIKLNICEGDGSPETAINCANEFVSENVPLVVDAYDPSMGGAVPVLKSAGIPIIGTLAATAVADAAPYGDAFYFTGPTQVSALGMISVLKDMGKKTASLAVADYPASHAYVDKLIGPIGKKMGVDVNVQYIPAQGANLTVSAAAEIADKPDVAGIISLPEDGCTSLFQALRQQGFAGTLWAGSCSQFIDVLGASAAGAVVQPRLWVPLSRDSAPAEVQKELDAFAKSMEAVKHGKELSARTLYSFAAVVNTAKVLETISGDITATSVVSAMKGLKDFPTFAGPKVTCDGKQWQGFPSACSRDAIFFEVTKDGKLRPVNAGGYTQLDPSAIPGNS